ncbi:H-type small acid-soluble spore protein, partial [Bacillus pseudomycoides]|nr:H-type small acid-soluble spore protein [Bacillus pseudomycoides]
MNVQRAKELSESSEQAHVSFQGMPVMIQHVDESNETARIY